MAGAFSISTSIITGWVELLGIAIRFELRGDSVFWGLTGLERRMCGAIKKSPGNKGVPQRPKPLSSATVAARLKPCP
jgi:hypothetical protein